MDDTDRKKNDFSEILEGGPKSDNIFKDDRPPFGSDPYAANPKQPKVLDELELENESFFTIHKKYAAVEKILALINKECSFGELISEILLIAMEQSRSEAGSFLEIDYEHRCMFFRAVSGKSSQSLLKVTIPLGAGIVGHVCETRKMVVLSEIEDSSMYLKSIENLVGFEARDVIAAPIVIRGATFGCLELLNCIGSDHYGDAEKEVLQAICEFAGKIIENRLVMAAFSKELEGYRDGAKKAA
ncbi:MAG: GAF domain-containing protein [Deltaproteobacteria bacterium]|nr:GAF domain-containing protein [Deltaproteobacteria bacterium]